MELSIIVPVYNVEKYLPKCLDSILAQTFTDFELILIDDGSPDDCGKIIDSYAEKDSRIVAIHQKNKGVSAARNAGLRIAKGKYIGFVDPDDYIEADMYAKMIESAENKNADIVCCDFSRVDESGEVSHRNLILPEVMDRDEFMVHLFDIPRTIGGSVCNKLFVRDKISDEFDQGLALCEDWWFLYKYLLNISTATYIGKEFYFVVYRATSATHTIKERNLLQITVREKALQQLQGVSRSVKNAAEADYLDQCVLLRNEVLNCYDEVIYSCVKDCFRKYVKKNFIGIVSNKCISFSSKLLYAKLFFKFS